MMALYALLVLLLGVLLVSVVGTVALYIVTWYDHVNLARKADDPSWRRDIRILPILLGIGAESLAVFVSLVTYPLHLYYDRIPGKARPCEKPPVLLVHCWGGASHFFILVRFLLRTQGFANVYSLTYRPITGDAARLARQVDRRIDHVLQETGAQQVILITHSMGGVLSRYAIKNLKADGKVKKVIALGGPHRGSRIASFMPIGINTLQMTYQSDFCKDLARDGMTPGSAEYVSIYSLFDNMVLPPHSSDLGAGARNHLVPYHGHVALVYSPWVLSLIREELKGV